MVLLSLLVSILFIPIYIPTLFTFYVLNEIIHMVLRIKYRSRVQFLESADTYWAVGESYHNQSYILTILKDRCSGDIAKEIEFIIEEKLLKNSKNYTKLLCSLNTLLGYPYLIKETFKAKDFLTIIEITKLHSSIKDIIYDLNNKPLPLNGKLLWEVIVIKGPPQWKKLEGLREDQIPVIIRENHTLTDGLSLMNLIANTFAEKTVDFSSYLKNIPRSPKSNMIITFSKNIFLFLIVPGYLVVETMKRLCNKNIWKCSNILHKPNIAYKCEEFGENLVNLIKSLKKEIGDISFTEIVIAAISNSLYKHFLKENVKIPESVILLVVASKDLQPLTVNGIPILRNQFGLVNFELPIKIYPDSMLKRLEVLKSKTRSVINSPTSLVDSFILFNLMSLFPIPIIKRLFPMHETVGISNLPGFPNITICNGYEVEDIYFFLPQRDTNGIGFSVFTYDNRLHIGLTADQASIPSKDQCESIVSDFFKNIKALKTEVVSKNQTNVIDIRYD